MSRALPHERRCVENVRCDARDGGIRLYRHARRRYAEKKTRSQRAFGYLREDSAHASKSHQHKHHPIVRAYRHHLKDGWLYEAEPLVEGAKRERNAKGHL